MISYLDVNVTCRILDMIQGNSEKIAFNTLFKLRDHLRNGYSLKEPFHAAIRRAVQNFFSLRAKDENIQWLCVQVIQLMAGREQADETERFDLLTDAVLNQRKGFDARYAAMKQLLSIWKSGFPQLMDFEERIEPGPVKRAFGLLIRQSVPD